jgi:hypothetical protein
LLKWSHVTECPKSHKIYLLMPLMNSPSKIWRNSFRPSDAEFFSLPIHQNSLQFGTGFSTECYQARSLLFLIHFTWSCCVFNPFAAEPFVPRFILRAH